MSNKMIDIFVNIDDIYIWSSKDACDVREKHRIVGTLVGSHPRAPRQNIHLHLPMQLLPEEAKCLIEKGFAQLIDDSQPMLPPTTVDTRTFEQNRRRSYEVQKQLQIEKRRLDIQSRKQQIIDGKKAKRLKLLQEKGDDIAAEVDEDAVLKAAEEEVESMELTPIPYSAMQVQVFTGTPGGEENHSILNNWPYPATDEDKLKYRVFFDLWEKGHFLTPGGKFGGDYLVYPGDPAMFHSFYIAKCLPYKQEMSALDLIAMARLGSTVKKTVILCSIDDNDKLCYTSLKWSGIS